MRGCSSEILKRKSKRYEETELFCQARPDFLRECLQLTKDVTRQKHMNRITIKSGMLQLKKGVLQ